MALPIFRQQNASKIRVTIKDYAKQIIRLSFVPICRSPYTRNCQHVRIIFVQQNLETNSVMPGSREKVVIDFKARLFFYTAIRAAEIGQKIKTRVGPRL